MWVLFFLGCLVPDVAQGMRAEACAIPAYSATALKEGVDAGKILMDLAIGLEEGRSRDVCCDVPQEPFLQRCRRQSSGYHHVWHDALALFCQAY